MNSKFHSTKAKSFAAYEIVMASHVQWYNISYGTGCPIVKRVI
jgi:hypothetical protein